MVINQLGNTYQADRTLIIHIQNYSFLYHTILANVPVKTKTGEVIGESCL